VILKRDDVPPASVRLTIIVVATKTDGESVRQKLQSGASFEAVAREYSRHPSASESGEFGVFPVADIRQEFRTALDRVKPGGFTEVIPVQRPATPSDWPDGVPPPGTSLKDVENMLGRAYSSSTTLPADGQSAMTELTYPFGLRLRIHETRGLGFIEFTPPWKSTIFGLRPDDQIPTPIYDLFPRTGRFIRGVPVGVPSHPNWYIDVDDRVDAVSRVLFVDRGIYGNLPDVPKGH
jgi:PPIC-type peptidyl-prolyl cis-trans isomerase-like protein